MSEQRHISLSNWWGERIRYPNLSFIGYVKFGWLLEFPRCMMIHRPEYLYKQNSIKPLHFSD